MPFDNSNRKHLREAEKAATILEQNRIAYVRQIMGTVGGRAWAYQQLLKCSVFHTPFVAGAPDITAFNCGKQNVGLEFFGDIASACPHEYTLMMTEASTKEAAHDRRNSESDSRTATRAAAEPGWNAAESTSAYTVDADGFVHDASAGAEDTGAAEGTSTH